MIKKFKHIIFIFYLGIPFLGNSQSNNDEKTFIGSNLFTKLGVEACGISGTNDEGFVYTIPFGYCAMDSNFTKFNLTRKLKDCSCIGKLDFSPYNPEYFTIDRSLLVKSNANGKIEWMKPIYNEGFLFDAGNSGLVKQTKDGGYLCYLRGRILKLDDNGNVQWKIYFNKDTIPNIKKTDFLCKSPISDIYECQDGSFIALLNASFSILKISKDGKPLWLKSLAFDEFRQYVSERWPSEGKKKENKPIYPLKLCELTIDSTWYYVNHVGIYIPSYNVYQTDDGGYMAIGKNDYQCKVGTKIIDSSFIKHTYTACGICKTEYHKNAYEEIPFQTVLEFDYTKKYKIADSVNEKECPRLATVVVKTDKDGNVQWKKSYGEYHWSDSDVNSAHSDLIKLANGKWLVRIRDCSRLGEHTFPDSTLNYYDWSAASSRVFIIDNDGNTLKERWIGDDAYNMVLAADSGYFANRAYDVTKYDKNFKVEWRQGTDVTTRAYSGTRMSATADSGVVCDGGGGYIIKIDKYGHAPSNDFSVTVSTNADTAFFTRHLQGMKNRNAKLIIKPIQLEFREEKFNKETGYSYEYKTREVRKKDIIKMIFLNDQFAYFLRGNRYDNNFGNYRKEIKLQVEEGTLKEYPEEYFHTYPVLPGKKKDLPQKPSFKKLTPEESRLNIANEGYEFVLDLNDKLQLNNLIIEALYGNYIECEFGGSGGIVVTDLGTGTYEYEVQGEKNEIIASGKFEIKEKKK